MNVATAVYVGIMIGGLLIMGAMYLGPQEYESANLL
jgi:hypothetical protein